MSEDGRSEVSNVHVMVWQRWTMVGCTALGMMWGGPIVRARGEADVSQRALLRADSVHDTTDLTLPLPVSRILAHPPAVAQVGVFPSTAESVVDRQCCITEGAWTSMITASVADQDLRAYDRQLQSVFPGRNIDDPRDSLYQARVARAEAWVARLTSLRGTPVSGSQLLPLAMVAFRAERDTLARRLIELRLTQLVSLPVEQSLVLATAVEMLTDAGQSSTRFASNFLLAESYASRLASLPVTGYATRIDSLDVHERQVGAIGDLLTAAERLRDPGLVLSFVNRFISRLRTLSADRRSEVIRVEFPYRTVAEALTGRSDGDVQLDSLDARLLDVARWRTTEWPVNMTPAQRATQQARVQHEVEETFVAFRQLGHPAPPVTAHAWLNTPDSIYARIPRVHPFDDGIVRLIAFGRRIDDIVPMLDRIQRQLPNGIQVVFVTETEGHGGPDLLSPADEVAWLRKYYAETRKVRFVVAVWAGDKVSQESPIPSTIVRLATTHRAPVEASTTVSAFDTISVSYQRTLPTRSPVPARYRLLTMHAECVLVDGRGMVRGYSTISSPRDEADVIQQLIALR